MENINKNKLISLLDKFVDRSDRWMTDALSREDMADYCFYKGQETVINELKDMVGKFE